MSNTNPQSAVHQLSDTAFEVRIGRSSQGDSDQHASAMAAKAANIQTRDEIANPSNITVNIGEGAGRPDAGGRITSARTAAGMPISGDRIGENSVIEIGGMQMLIRDAVAAHAVVRNADGTYSMVRGDASPK